jgi:hypothetical protein
MLIMLENYALDVIGELPAGQARAIGCHDKVRLAWR